MKELVKLVRDAYGLPDTKIAGLAGMTKSALSRLFAGMSDQKYRHHRDISVLMGLAEVCPFCGDSAKVCCDEHEPGFFSVVCDCCGATGPTDTTSMRAWKSWKKRKNYA
jgi:transcriptional regulator with XRE-family HTH domain